MKKRHFALVVGWLAIVSVSVPGAVVHIPGTSNLWLAGMPDGTPIAWGDRAPDQSPVLATGITLPCAQWIEVSNVTGTVSNDGPDPYLGPDGGSMVAHRDGPALGKSGLTAPMSALIGVFLDDLTPSDPVPSSLTSTTELRNSVFVYPLLKQPFFIGDGKTDNGTRQRIVIPPGATRLFLGTQDSYGWFNNAGSFDAEVAVFSDNVLNDNFDDNVTGTTLWSKVEQGGPTALEVNGRLEVTFPVSCSSEPGATFHARYNSLPKLVGNFDIQVSYQLLTWPAHNGVRVALCCNNSFRLERVSRGSAEGDGEQFLITANEAPPIGVTSTSDMAGTLRVIRVDNKLSGYVLISGTWQKIGEVVCDSVPDMDIRLQAWSEPGYFSSQPVTIAFDNFVVHRGTFNLPVTGSVVLQDYIADKTGPEVAVELRPTSGAANITRTIHLNPDGSFTLTNVPLGIYNVAVKSSHWLRSIVPNVTVGAGAVDLGAIHVVNGDANNDNVVNFADYLLFSQAFGENGSDADFNGDGQVNFSDYLILSQSYGQSGGGASPADMTLFQAASTGLIDPTAKTSEQNTDGAADGDLDSIVVQHNPACAPLTMIILTMMGAAFYVLSSLRSGDDHHRGIG